MKAMNFAMMALMLLELAAAVHAVGPCDSEICDDNWTLEPPLCFSALKTLGILIMVCLILAGALMLVRQLVSDQNKKRKLAVAAACLVLLSVAGLALYIATPLIISALLGPGATPPVCY